MHNFSPFYIKIYRYKQFGGLQGGNGPLLKKFSYFAS